MALRRAAGAILMLAGTGWLAGVAWLATILAAAGVQARKGAADIMMDATVLGWPIAGGVVLMLLGRLAYGDWREAAPIANVTGDVTRTAGVLVSIAMGGLLVFLLASGFEAEDMPAAVGLGLGVAGGVLLAQFGAGLRSGARRYLD